MATIDSKIVLETEKTRSVKEVAAGSKLEYITRAQCKGEEGVVKVTKYKFPPTANFINDQGYKPLISETKPPTYLQGEITNDPPNPLLFYPVGSPKSLDTISATATAKNVACGEFDASSTQILSTKVLTLEPLKMVGNTTLGNFVIRDSLIHESLVFGLGTPLTDPGFKYIQDTGWAQKGWFGIIQLFKGEYSYQLEGSSIWTDVIKEDDFVLDVEPANGKPQAAVMQKCRISEIFTRVKFVDAPAVYVSHWLSKRPRLAAVRLSAELKTWLVFNPSLMDDPDLDPNTIWCPVGEGARWVILGQTRWDGKGSKDKVESWSVELDKKACGPMSAFPFPSWEKAVDRGEGVDEDISASVSGGQKLEVTEISL